jgi:hypothetical protein
VGASRLIAVREIEDRAELPKETKTTHEGARSLLFKTLENGFSLGEQFIEDCGDTQR